MDQNLCSGLEEKPSCPVNKSVKGLLNEVQSVYGEKLRRLECEIKCSPEEILKMKVQILHSYISDLSDQNRILVHTVEELEKEANEKVTDLKAKLQTSDEGIKDLDCQRRRLEEDNKSLRAEIQQLKGDARTLVTCLPLRPQTLENVAERSDLSTRISQNPGDLLKAQVEHLQNQLKTKSRIIHRLKEEMKTLLSHRVQEKMEGKRVTEALEEVCKEEVCIPRTAQKRAHNEIHKTESKLSAAQKRLHATTKQLMEMKTECEQKQKEVEKLREDATRCEMLVKEHTEDFQRVITEKRTRELELTAIAEKHRIAQQEVSSRDQAILQLRVELRLAGEKNQGMQEELGLQEAEVSRLNEKVRKQQAYLQELSEMCRHGNACIDHEQQKTQQLHCELQLAQQQLKRQAERMERLQGELTGSRLDHTADAERWTLRNLLLQAEVQQLQEQNVQHTEILGELKEKLRDAQEKEREYEEFLKKRDVEIRLLTQQLEEIQDEAQKSRNSSQSHRSALDIFKQKYTTAMEKVQQLQVQMQRAEEEAELFQIQAVEARADVCSLRAEMSVLETRYKQKARQAALTEEAMELLTDDLQVALDVLRNQENQRNLQHQEETEKLRVRTTSQQKKVEKELALVKSELQNTLLILKTRTKELQELHEEMQKASEVKNVKEENEVMRNKLEQMGNQLQELLAFFTDTADAVLRQEDEKTEQQLSNDPEEEEDICQIARLQWTVEKLRAEARLFLKKAVEEAETQQTLVCEAARERDEAREQLQGLKQNLEETQTENSHLHQEREKLVTNINLWITEHKAANKSLARRIKRHCEVLSSVSLERENAHKKQLADNLSKIDNIQSRLRSNVQSVEMLNQQLSRMSEENKKNRKLLEKERKMRSHLELLLGFRVTQSSGRLTSPPSLELSDLDLESVQACFSVQLGGMWEKRPKSALH
ncbi:plectin-like isoform X1 [Silurus meridionalis]|uniref:plectin-like isoform X1 n=1 Tax=Silurus meridionalis TaxID=175797 RepID=UPI001EEAB460|nr:plectin-like isoform X1 [Silurus meridionalis]